jgi:putative acetyltransferase
MKRLYLKPAYRGLGLGRGLALTVLHEAATRGYDWMRLDTIESMTGARDI